MTILAELVACEEDSMGYITYVFKSLEDFLVEGSPYVMCTRFPNWQCRTISIGEIGYVSFTEVKAGYTQWYDGNSHHYYLYDNIQFNKFIEKKDPKTYEYVM